MNVSVVPLRDTSKRYSVLSDRLTDPVVSVALAASLIRICIAVLMSTRNRLVDESDRPCRIEWDTPVAWEASE